MKIHPLAEKFPMMSETELQDLADDISDNGLHHPIITWRSVVVDGRNRLAACDLAGVKPRLAEGDFASEHDVTKFIISMNIQRRHLSAGQRAMLGEELRPGLEVEAKERQKISPGRPKKGITNSYDLSEKPNRKQPGNVNARIGLTVGVGAGTVAVAAKVKKAAPELADKVISGEMTLNAADRALGGTRGIKHHKRKIPAPPPMVDISTLQGSAREKLEAAIRQEKRVLQSEFEKAVQVELARALEETVLPTYNKEKAEFRMVIEARKGFMPRSTYRLILSCLHPDRAAEELKSTYTKAFHAFSELELVLCSEKELPTVATSIPRTYEELMRRRQEVKAQRRKQSNGVTHS